VVHPWVADEGDGVQIRRVAPNTLNKESWKADKGWSSSLVWCGANSFLLLKTSLLQNVTQSVGIVGLFWTW